MNAPSNRANGKQASGTQPGVTAGGRPGKASTPSPRPRPMSVGSRRVGRSARSDLASLVDQLARNSEEAVAHRRTQTQPAVIDLTDRDRSNTTRRPRSVADRARPVTTIDLRSIENRTVTFTGDDQRSSRPIPRAIETQADSLGLFDLGGNQMTQSNVSSGMESNWMTRGNCSNHPPETFFPSDGVGVEVAKKICADCPSQEPCLEYALAHRIDHGVWGGTSERQRRRILKARKEARIAISGRSR